jgi:surface protein
MAQVVGGVQAPKYMYLPNATVRYNKLNYTYEKTTTFNDTYVRPSDWLTLPEVNNGDEVVYMLVSVYENTPSYVGFAVNGDFTVDWGDGNIINYDGISQTSATHRVNHVLNWEDLDESTLTSEGYRQAIVKITPQVPGTLTKFDLAYAYQSELNLVTYSNILDVKIAGQNISIFRPGSTYHKKMEQIEFVGSHSITNASSLFINSKIKKLVSFDMTNITNGTSMFNGCSNLIELPSDFDTSNLTECGSMFKNCSSLEKISLDLTSCTSAIQMFDGSNKIKEANLQNTGNVTTMNKMFLNCSSLETVTGLDTSSATNLSALFDGCSNLIDVPQIDLQNCTTAYRMFVHCSSIVRFENGLINTSGVSNMSYMFHSCNSLLEIPKDFDTSGCTSMYAMFHSTSSLGRIPLLNTDSVTDMQYMFSGSGIIELPEGFNTSNVTSTNYMFKNCSSLEKISLDLTSCTSAIQMFDGSNKIKEVNLQNTGNVTNMNKMFLNCSSLETVTGLDTSSATVLSNAFQGCSNLKNLPLLDLQNCTTTFYMFIYCSSLEGFPNGLINTSGVSDMRYMFHSCSSLRELPSDFNTDSANIYAMFMSTGLKTIPQINTSNSQSNLHYLFNSSKIEIIPDLDFSLTTNVTYIFNYCNELRKIGILDMSNVTSASYMLRGNFELSESNIFGLTKSHSYSTNKLSRLALINIFNNLGNATSQTIDVRNNPGTSDLTPEDIAIAISKGWTVTV